MLERIDWSKGTEFQDVKKELKDIVKEELNKQKTGTSISQLELNEV